jgi:diketogulonate reductase-like aldo/keto reductase
MEHDDRSAAIAALRAGVDLGLTHVDTAEMYGSGAVESLLGEALAGLRDRVFLVSKVLPSNATYQGTIAACEATLSRLGTDHLDVYLLHWSGPHSLEETFRAFEKLVAEGKIRAFGVSNFDAGEMEEAVRIAGSGKIACNQVLYHLEERDIEHEVVPTCRAHDVAIVAYSPFGSGQFPDPSSAGGRALATIADAHGVSPRAVALAFLGRDGIFTIPKSSDRRHVADNARALELRLTEADLAAIDAAFPLRKKRRWLPTL